MAKKMRMLLTVLLSLTLMVSLIATPAAAAFQAPATQNTLKNTEYIQANVNGKTHLVDKGSSGTHTWLIQGTYSYDIELVDGTNTLNYRIGKQTGTYSIPMPEGYEGYLISEVEIDCAFNKEDSTNSHSDRYDNAIIDITITKVVNPDTGEEIEIPPVDPNPDPDPVDPNPDPDPQNLDPDPVDPTPDPDPVDPNPNPDPVDPNPDPDPVDPNPDPDPVDPDPQNLDPDPVDPNPDPDPVDPNPDPDPVDPDPDPSGGEPVPFDDDVPLAEVPKTGDPSLLWAAVSALSAGSLALVNRKKKEE